MSIYTFVFSTGGQEVARRSVGVDSALALADKIELAYAWAYEKPGRSAEVYSPGLRRSTCCPYLVDQVMKRFSPASAPAPAAETEWVDPWAGVDAPEHPCASCIHALPDGSAADVTAECLTCKA